MKTFIRFVILGTISLLAIAMAIILGDYGAWYLAWLLGTVMLVLISAVGAALLDTQEAERRQNSS